MASKTPSSQPKTKIADITKPDMAADVKTPQIIIEKRARAVAPDSSSDVNASAPAKEASAEPAAAPSIKHTTINPITPSEEKAAPEVEPAVESTPPEPTAPESAPPDAPDTSVSAPAKSSSVSAASDLANAKDATSDSSTKSDVVKAAESQKQAELESKRQKQIDGYIDTKEFFVPINAAARKRSIEVSLWLTLVYIILSVILVDLMLDTGMIDLLHKVPHTNFF